MRDYTKFFTPDHISDMLVEMADIRSGHKILEPSAGDGAIIRAIRKRQKVVRIYAVENNPDHYKALSQISTYTVIEDFLKVNFIKMRFDRIVANPPFGNDVDLHAHFNRMKMLLTTKGLITMIAPRSFVPASIIHRHDIPNWSMNSDGTNTAIHIIQYKAGL